MAIIITNLYDGDVATGKDNSMAKLNSSTTTLVAIADSNNDVFKKHTNIGGVLYSTNIKLANTASPGEYWDCKIGAVDGQNPRRADFSCTKHSLSTLPTSWLIRLIRRLFGFLFTSELVTQGMVTVTVQKCTDPPPREITCNFDGDTDNQQAIAVLFE